MADIIEKKIQKEFEKADGKLGKAKVVAAVAGLAPVVAAGIAGEKAVEVAKEVANKAKELNMAAQLKKDVPLLPETFYSDGFAVPNMVKIVDDAVKKGNDGYNGAIGWLNDQSGMEVLNLYDEEVMKSGLSFTPVPVCDAVYYVDPNIRNRYINIDELFDTFQKQKIAELTNVAFCLGARSYSIEIIEEETVDNNLAAKVENNINVKAVKAGLDASHEESLVNKTKRRAKFTGEYEERRKPIEPELKWFKNDDTIVGLIKQVCYGGGTIKNSTMVFEGSKYAGMSKSTAAKVDATVKKIGGKTSANISEQTNREYASKMIFIMEF